MKATERGGYLEFEHLLGGNSYHANAIELNSGRSCLEYLIHLRDISHIMLPDLMCEVVNQVCVKLGVHVTFYPVGINFRSLDNLTVPDNTWLYLADYYGVLSEDAVEQASSMSEGRVIIDEVQGFFRPAWSGVDTIFTCRKFLGVPDGAYLVTGDGRRLETDLRVSKSASRMKHLFGRREGAASEYYHCYLEAEESIQAEGLCRMSDITRSILGAVDYPEVQRRRSENFRELRFHLEESNRLETVRYVGSYMYPYLVRDAEGVRDLLRTRGLYVPTFWPNVLRDCSPSSVAYDYAKNILPLPVDQRYNVDDMRDIASLVLQAVR